MLRKKARRLPRKVFLILLCVIGFAYLLALTIPLGTGIKLDLNESEQEFLWENEKQKFTFKVIKGGSYTVIAQTASSDIKLYVCNGPYGATGKLVDFAGEGHTEYYRFHATRTGKMSVIIKNSNDMSMCTVTVDDGIVVYNTEAALAVIPGTLIGMIFPAFVFIFVSIFIIMKYTEDKQKFIHDETVNLERITKIEEVLVNRDLNIAELVLGELTTDYVAVKKFYDGLNIDKSEKISEKLHEIHENLGSFLLDLATNLLEEGDHAKAELRVFDAAICSYENPRIAELNNQIQIIRQTKDTQKRIANLKQLNEQRRKEFEKIISRYTTIDLIEMAELLKFADKIALQEWLMSLPKEDEFIIEDDLVILPMGLKENAMPSDKIKKIVDSMEYYKHKTCYWCGYPISSDDEKCKECGQKIPICLVCKLPISFGDKIGKCPHCDAHGHIAHIQEWIKTQGKCPHCRKKLPVEAIVNVSQPEKKEL